MLNNTINLRKIVLALSVLQSLISLLFYKFSGLYFFLEERAELYPVNQLRSQGGNEDFLIAIGFILFLVLAFFNLLRFRKLFLTLDIVALLFTLLLQGLTLSLIEVGSFEQSLKVDHGWILLAWLIGYGSLWLVLIFSFIYKSER